MKGMELLILAADSWTDVSSVSDLVFSLTGIYFDNILI